MGLVNSMPIQMGIALAEAADKGSLYRVFVDEDIISRDIFTYLSILALKTFRIGIATGITSVYVRNIAVVASSAAVLQRISGGRFDLGLGVGVIPEVKRLIKASPRRPVEVLRDAAMKLRRIFRGEAVDIEAHKASDIQSFRLKIPVKEPRILFGVKGAKLTTLAGEFADGIILRGPKRSLFNSLKVVEDAAARAGRSGIELDKAVWLPLVEAKSQEDLELARITVARMVADMPQAELEPILGLAKLDKMLRLLRRGNYKAAARYIPEEAIGEFCLYGFVDDIILERKRLEHLGFTELVVGPPFGRSPIQAFETVKQLVGSEC
ncbi:MAG: LLM class flavin-dependent oxidoreductase [Candidatus Bathyarchaeia archaeon]